MIDVPTISDPTGAIGVIEKGSCVPFEPKRTYFLHRLEVGAARGGHAHKSLHQLLVAASGVFLVELDDGSTEWEFCLDSPSMGLYCPPGYWRNLVVAQPQSILLVAASDQFDENDYIRERDAFVEWRKTLN